MLIALALAQASTPDATLTFRFERDGLPVPKLLITVHPDGSGAFAATVIPDPPPTSRYAAYPSPTPQPATEISRPITLSPAMTRRIFDQVHSTAQFHYPCESRAKNIAFTGLKTFAYQGPEGQGTCTFNYTENKTIAALTDTFLAIALTLDEGRRLEQLHRYDRLGLDQEMRQLVTAQHDGRALELANIAPVLTGIANDPQVLERVRSRATELLALTAQ